MSMLFSPLTLGNLTLPNRIIIAPMCQYAAENGKATEWHMMHFGTLSHSGAGLFIIEATAVTPEGRISPQDLGLWDDDTERALLPIIRAVRKHSAIPLGIQLSHAGRKASTCVPWAGRAFLSPEQGGWQTLAPSAQPYHPDDIPPVAMSHAQIKNLIDAFAASAKRADRLGFDVIEIHAAHGYLLHQFLSPLTNLRDDEYGGSLSNRLRLLHDVYLAVRKSVASHKVVGVRISATDGVDAGWDLAQSITLGTMLKQLGCDYIHVSSGGLSPLQQIKPAPNYQVPFARKIREETGLTTFAVGLITEPEQAEAIVATGDADAVALARAILFNPRWPWHAAVKLQAQVTTAPQFWRSEPRYASGLFRQS